MPKTVLVVDDDEGIQNLVGMALVDEGYEVIAALNGAIGLEMATQHPVDMILLDMRMPVLDGWGFLDAYCSRPEPRAPVVAFSANIVDPEAFRCASGFFPKPFKLSKLLDMVDKYANTSS